jgi:hypothetical protein
MGWTAVGLHLGSAALVAAGAAWYRAPLGHAFAVLYLVSTWFRPALEYYRALKARLGQLLEEVRYPRADVRTLVETVQRLEDATARHARDLEALEARAGRAEAALAEAEQDGRRRLEAIARRFEETIDRLTDNQEVITGIKAFLRLVREGGRRDALPAP